MYVNLVTQTMNKLQKVKQIFCILFHEKFHQTVTLFSEPCCRISGCQRCGCQHVDYRIATLQWTEKRQRMATRVGGCLKKN